ncbi:MAG TPA: ATP-binding protein [Herpetosiphonaceae bacterium]
MQNLIRRLRLSTLLIGLNVGLLLLAVTGVAFVAVRLLQQLADEQALARVSQAGLIARQEIVLTGDDALTSARLLAERPTLHRMLRNDDAPALATFLAQFQQTSQLSGSAVLRDGRIVARSGADLPWSAIWAARQHDEMRFLHPAQPDDPLILGAWASLPEQPGSFVIVAHLLDATFAQALSAELSLPTAIVNRQTARTSAPPHAALREQTLTTGEPAAARIDAQSRYVAVVPVRAFGSDTVGLVEITMPTSSVTRSLQKLVQTLLVLALLVTTLAALASLLIGRRLGQPLQALTVSAERIGHGDLATPVPVASGAEIGTLATTLDEMRRHLLQLTADLRRQQAEAQAIVTGIVEGVFTVDRQRRIRYLNPQAAALLGVEAHAAIGRFCGDVLNPQGPGGVRPCEEQCPIVHARFRGGARATEHLLLRDGQRRTVVITSAQPEEEQQVQVLRDETEIEATRRLRDSVLANISHEFRTPLSAQLASIELLLDQLPDLTIDQIGHLVLALQRGTLRLTQLIDNLLESARIESGQSTIRHRPVALDEVVESALELAHPLIDQRGQDVVVELPYPLPVISGDAPRLTQVFVNLLANANKFAPPGSTIRIGGAVDRTTVTLWVQDQGPGMPQHAGPALFGRFVRSSDEEPEQSGVGLGLWITKSIVERHGGRIAVQSADSGTRIEVILPQEQTHETISR